MQRVVWLRGGMGLLLSLALCLPALADEALKKALELYGQQNYKAAQDAALQVDANSLTDAEKAQFDDLKSVLPDAISGAERAAQDLAAADQAYEKGDWEAAGKLYKSVDQNNYATDGQSDQARDRLSKISEKRQLADAAKPSGSVTAKVEFQESPAAKPGDEPVAEVDNSGHTTPSGEMELIDKLNWERALAQAEALKAQSREAAADRRFADAKRLADEAIQKIEAARAFAATESTYRAQRDAAIAHRNDIDKQNEAFERDTAQLERIEIRNRIEQREKLLKQQREEKIAQLFNTTDQLRREKRYREAAEVLRQILFIDPSNARAREGLVWAEDSESFDIQEKWLDDLHSNQRGAVVKADEALIPWDYEVLYPRNWVEITRNRGVEGVGPGGSSVDNELERKLSETLPEKIELAETPLEQVFEFLEKMTNVNFSVDWEDLVSNGISRDKPVTMKLANLKFRTVLGQLLTQVGGDVKLAFRVGEGLIQIATKDKLDKIKEVRVYDIRDLLIEVPRFSARTSLDASQALSGAQGGGGGGNLFQDQQDENTNDENRDPTAGSPLVGAILDIIRQTVEPDSWRETGGGDGSLRHLNGQLIVYNTSDAHRQVIDLLNQLRAAKSLQISVETRFLNVVSNFLEQFGVDLDFVFNSGTAGFDRGLNTQGVPLIDPSTGASVLVPRQFSQIGTLPNRPGFGRPIPPQQGQALGQPYYDPALVPRGGGVIPQMDEFTPIGASQGSLNLVDPSAINTAVPGSWAQRAALAPALAISGSFLDNLQVDFLIRATQANSRSSIVQAPRLVFFNGQRARISVGRQRGYVASVRPVLAEGAVGVQPQIQFANSGTELIVDGTISADRKYVTLTIRTTQADEPAFERFEIQRASGNSPGIFVLLLDQTFSRIETTVSVPDGGTVLLGGVKQVGEVEVEAGVPILSKIPILKRAFSNTTTVKDTRTLLILCKAKIIIQKEAEAEAFPSMAGLGG